MKALFRIPERAIGNRYYYCKKRKTEFGPILTYPEKLNDLNGFHVNIIPAFSKIMGDYKLYVPGDSIYWIYKEFVKIDYTLDDKDFEIKI
jgi:hypothetical protein